MVNLYSLDHFHTQCSNLKHHVMWENFPVMTQAPWKKKHHQMQRLTMKNTTRKNLQRLAKFPELAMVHSENWPQAGRVD